MLQKEKYPNPSVPEPAPFETDEESFGPRESDSTERNETKSSKGPEPTLESGERRSMMERPDAQDQKI